MPDGVSPILNSPFTAPTRHFRLEDGTLSGEVVDGRRPSVRILPAPPVRRKGQQTLDIEGPDRVEENPWINRLRSQLALWRVRHDNVTPTTRRLLEHWTDPDRPSRLFFCQIEALETLIFLTEVAPRHDRRWLEELRLHNGEVDLLRMACKMATGSGKTVVMAMIVAWHTLNKAANPQDKRFGDAFLVVAPGLTIRDRLCVLRPSDPDNYYDKRDLVPEEDRKKLGRAKVHVVNFHQMRRRKLMELGEAKEELLRPRDEAKVETERQMVERVLRELGGARNVIVLNDEAHHCYDARPRDEEVRGLSGDEKKAVKAENEKARLWINGLRAVARHRGVRAVYDLSATPYYLRGSGWPEGTLFPWVVSDFDLLEAIEAGIVKIPRLPVEDDGTPASLEEDHMPLFRNVYDRVKDDLKGLKRGDDLGFPGRLPGELEIALKTLYRHFEKRYKAAEATPGAALPVFIVVANNVAASDLIYRRLSGDAGMQDFPLFVNGPGGVSTILVDSEQLDSGDPLPADFKKAAARELELLRETLRRQGRDEMDDAALLRETMNTVGRPGTLGGRIRCVVSVSMLTEGWDANTVTHILGVRAFGTQLLCEQVVGRGLRRMSYEPSYEEDADGRFSPEYAEVFGVPFTFVKGGRAPTGGDAKPKTLVYSVPGRRHQTIAFPRVVGYRRRAPKGRLVWSFDPKDQFVLDTRDLPGVTIAQGVVGEELRHVTYDRQRLQAVLHKVAQRLLEDHFMDPDAVYQPDRYPELVRAVREWFDAGCLLPPGDRGVAALDTDEIARMAADRVRSALKPAEPGEDYVVPELAPDPIGDTDGVEYWTSKPVRVANDLSPLSGVVLDSGWEGDAAFTLETFDGVLRYVKNVQRVGFRIPWFKEGRRRWYEPDFIVHLDDGHDDPLQVIVEISGDHPDKPLKIGAVRDLWLPAVNRHGGFGRWELVEVNDHGMLRAALHQKLGQDELSGV